MYFIKSFLKRKRRIRKAKAWRTKITRVGVGNLCNREVPYPRCHWDFIVIQPPFIFRKWASLYHHIFPQCNLTTSLKLGFKGLWNKVYELASRCPKCNSDVHTYDESLKLNYEYDLKQGFQCLNIPGFYWPNLFIWFKWDRFKYRLLR